MAAVFLVRCRRTNAKKIDVFVVIELDNDKIAQIVTARVAAASKTVRSVVSVMLTQQTTKPTLVQLTK